jgi:hypothetical protein
LGGKLSKFVQSHRIALIALFAYIYPLASLFILTKLIVSQPILPDDWSWYLRELFHTGDYYIMGFIVFSLCIAPPIASLNWLPFKNTEKKFRTLAGLGILYLVLLFVEFLSRPYVLGTECEVASTDFHRNVCRIFVFSFFELPYLPSSYVSTILMLVLYTIDWILVILLVRQILKFLKIELFQS